MALLVPPLILAMKAMVVPVPILLLLLSMSMMRGRVMYTMLVLSVAKGSREGRLCP